MPISFIFLPHLLELDTFSLPEKQKNTLYLIQLFLLYN